MRPSKRLRGLFAALLCAAAAVAAYPTKPVMLVVPYPAGGGSDGVARSYNARSAPSSASRCWSTTWAESAAPWARRKC